MTNVTKVCEINQDSLNREAKKMIEVASGMYRFGWMLGTGGNISTLISEDPLVLQISSSGVQKGRMKISDFITVNELGEVLSGNLKPSAETLLHIAIIKATGSRSVIHTHSVNSTLLSEIYSDEGFICIEGYEMLKALRGNKSHESVEIIPIIGNSQDMHYLYKIVFDRLQRDDKIHGFILKGHGLYTWGMNLNEAKTHTEGIEFLLDLLYRKILLNGKE
ncbi:methylthioribulose 1-phosphate dehydratase [Cuniculiplasma sp. SKW3]|uniref:methylthioribulose 1-phosphate dehydratase n=1 Tax=unclassified Cuniculiplasma TaxID=2619706 RepID=UPI003FD2F11E